MIEYLVVGLISATALRLAVVALDNGLAWVLFTLALLVLYRWHARAAVALVMLGSGIFGLLLFT